MHLFDGFYCVSCKLLGLGCRNPWGQPAWCLAGPTLLEQWFAWQPVQMVIAIIVGVSVAVFLIAYFAGTVLQVLERK
jgi:hypothetical protein